jgi:hypothetical protein
MGTRVEEILAWRQLGKKAGGLWLQRLDAALCARAGEIQFGG